MTLTLKYRELAVQVVNARIMNNNNLCPIAVTDFLTNLSNVAKFMKNVIKVPKFLHCL